MILFLFSPRETLPTAMLPCGSQICGKNRSRRPSGYDGLLTDHVCIFRIKDALVSSERDAKGLSVEPCIAAQRYEHCGRHGSGGQRRHHRATGSVHKCTCVQLSHRIISSPPLTPPNVRERWHPPPLACFSGPPAAGVQTLFTSCRPSLSFFLIEGRNSFPLFGVLSMQRCVNMACPPHACMAWRHRQHAASAQLQASSSLIRTRRGCRHRTEAESVAVTPTKPATIPATVPAKMPAADIPLLVPPAGAYSNAVNAGAAKGHLSISKV